MRTGDYDVINEVWTVPDWCWPSAQWRPPSPISHAAMIRAGNLDEWEPVRQELWGWSWDANKCDVVYISPDGKTATFASRALIIQASRHKSFWAGYAR